MIWHPHQELTPEEEKHFTKLCTDERFMASVNSCVKEIARRVPECKGHNASADLFDEMREGVRGRSVHGRHKHVLHRGREALSRPNHIGGILRLTSDGAPRARSEGSDERSQA